ncbi:MAG: cytochrome P450 [Roseobacter sp.]
MKKLTQSPLDPEFTQNPYGLYAQVQAQDPLRFWQEYNMAAVFDAAQIQTLLKDRRLGRAIPAERKQPVPDHLTDFAALEAVSLLELEPPSHTRLRGLVLRAFTSRRIKALGPDIHDICDSLISKFPEGSFDLLPTYCSALPVRIIARLLGVPESMSADLLRWSNAMVAMYQAGRTQEIEVEANQAALDFTNFLDGYIKERENTPRDDLITHLIAAEADGEKLTRREMIGTCVLLLNAGHEATVHTLGNGVKALLENKTPRRALAPEHIAATVEEILRFDPPLHIFTRYAYEDIMVGTQKLHIGEQIALVLGAAGRDVRKAPDADVFDPFRKNITHSAFGGGLHFCVGAPLARMELQIGLQKLFYAAPELELTETPIYANSYHFHGLKRLCITRQPSC